MTTNGKTIKQIADEIGVSKQAVRNQIAKLGLQSSLRKIANQFAIDERQEALIIEAFSKKSQSENANHLRNEFAITLQSSLRFVEQENEFLKRQLEEKDEQLKARDRQLENLTAALEHTTESLHAAQALHAGTIQKQLADGTGDPAEPEPPGGIIARLLKKKRSKKK